MCKRLETKHRFFVFLRAQRHALLSEDFQKELVEMYRTTGAGKPPHEPGRMALLTLLQVYTKTPDHEAIERTLEPRWQMVLDWFDQEEPPVSQGALFDFRMRLLASGMDKRLLERSVEFARESGDFGEKALRAAVDSSPLFGHGRVEDTFNLLAHAARQVLGCIGRLTGHTVAEVVEAGELELLGGEQSLKAMLDVDWSEPGAKEQALERLLDEILALEQWILEHVPEAAAQPPLRESIETLRRLMGQDLEPDPSGGTRIAQKVAKDRQVSITDPEMRHGRKSSRRRFDGYKRHILHDLDEGLILGAETLPANQPEHEGLAPLLEAIEDQGRELASLHIDRGYLGAPAIGMLDAKGVYLVCRPWPAQGGKYFGKQDFRIDLNAQTVTCPAGEQVAGMPGQSVRFPKATCQSCPLRARCTTSAQGRSITLHTHEALHQKLRALPTTPEGRRELRERVAVEHALAHVGHRQGNQARYDGTRKNTYHLRLAAVVTNLQTADRLARAA